MRIYAFGTNYWVDIKETKEHIIVTDSKGMVLPYSIAEKTETMQYLQRYFQSLQKMREIMPSGPITRFYLS